MLNSIPCSDPHSDPSSSDLFKCWDLVQGCFNKFNLEDIYTLRKAIELQKMNKDWECGFAHMASLQLLTREFSYDVLLRNIYNYMSERVSEFMNEWSKSGHKIRMSDLEILFKRQPEFSISSKDWYGNYDVMNCKYRRRLTGKYPELDGLFDVLVYFV